MKPESGGDWVLYVRDGCHLCEEFLIELELEHGSHPQELRVVRVDDDPQLAARYGLRVPVLEVDGKPVCEGRYDGPRVRQALRV